MCSGLRVRNCVSSALSFIGGVHIGARALHVLNSIRSPIPVWRRGGNFLVQMIFTCLTTRGVGGGGWRAGQQPVVLVCRDPWCRTRASVLHPLEDLPKTSIIICFCNEAWSTLVRYTLQRKSHLCIPCLGIARPQSPCPHSCVCERFIYYKDGSTYFLQKNRQIERGNILIAHYGRTIHFLGIFVSNLFEFSALVFAVQY